MSNRSPFEHPTASIIKGLVRPACVSNHNKQECMILRDTSGSMQEEGKARDASRACDELISELAVEANKDAFHVGIIDFNDGAKVAHPFTKATLLDGKVAPISAGGETNITAALEFAKSQFEMGRSPQPEGVSFVLPVTLLMSDGCHNVGVGPTAAAEALRQQSLLVTVAFGSDADEDLLRAIATTPQHFYRCQNGRALRDFCAVFGKTLTWSIRAGINATAPLASLNK
jgi:uncharacterized protein YegL